MTGVQSSLLQVQNIPPVSIRDDLFLLEKDTVPLVIISPGPGKESFREQTMGKTIVYEYEVLIAYIVAANRLVGADLQGFLQVREDIRNQLYQINVPGLLEALDTNMEIGSVNKFSSMVGTTYRVTGWELRYSVAETRLGT